MQKKSPVKIAKTGTRKVAVAKGVLKMTPIVAKPTHEDIARRAYEIYAARGTGGREAEDWIQAERELLAKAHRNN